MSEPRPDDPDGAGPRSTRAPVDVRFSYANERTFLAWNRTALALITAGLAVTQLLPPFDIPGGRKMIGLPLIAMGTVVSVLSFVQWRRNEAAMHRGDPLPPSLLPIALAIVISIAAALALGLVVAS
jgi:putative membrane protein